LKPQQRDLTLVLRRPVELARHSGHWLRLGLDASVENDPEQT